MTLVSVAHGFRTTVTAWTPEAAALGWWPFGRTVVRRADAGAGSTIGNLIWFLIAHRIGCSGMSYRAGASGVLTPSASALPWAASAQMTKMSSVMIMSAQNG